jgi:hypothetical protein
MRTIQYLAMKKKIAIIALLVNVLPAYSQIIKYESTHYLHMNTTGRIRYPERGSEAYTKTCLLSLTIGYIL